MYRLVHVRPRPKKWQARVLLFLLEVFQPVFWLVGFVAKLIYRVLFSWWLNPLFDRWIRNGFAQEINVAIPWLFYLHGAKIVRDRKQNTNSESMGYLCLATNSLIFKFRRWRSENYGVEIAPIFAPTELYELPDVLHLVDPEANTKLRELDISWRSWGRLLEPRFHLIEQAFSVENFQETKARLAAERLSTTNG